MTGQKKSNKIATVFAKTIDVRCRQFSCINGKLCKTTKQQTQKRYHGILYKSIWYA